MTARRILLAALAFSAALLGAGAVLSLTGPAVPAQAAPTFDLGAVRALAGAGGPETLRTARVVAGAQPGFLLWVGGPLETQAMPVYPLELSWPDGRSMLIEPATDADCAAEFLPTDDFDPAAYARMQQAMLRAEAIVATHEHFDHLCGLTRSPNLDQLAGRALLTPEQLDGTAPMTAIDEGNRDRFAPLRFEHLHRAMPGVVLIKAPGHTTGSLWVYIKTAAGREWLLVGDTLWSHGALEHVAAKPHLITLFGEEDAEEQGRHLRFLADLAAQHPEVTILVAHAGERWEAALESGEMGAL